MTTTPERPALNPRKWWQAERQGEAAGPEPPRQGEPCPKCLMADLDYDTLFRLHCPLCGFIASCGAFT